MRFNPSLLLPLALLALGSLPACSNENENPDPDAGTYTFPDAGTDPGVSPTATCPAGAIVCETFEGGSSGWAPAVQNATIAAEGGRLHVLTQEGRDEKVTPNVQNIARWMRSIPAFGTQLFVRAHVYLTSLPGDSGQMGTFFVLMNTQSDFGGIELQVIKDTGFALDDWSGRTGQVWNRQGPPVNLGMSAGRWVCLEWEVRRASASATHGNARVYVDGALAHDFANIGMRAFDTFMVGYGFVHPQGPSGSETWLDNVAVSSTQRLGCQ